MKNKKTDFSAFRDGRIQYIYDLIISLFINVKVKEKNAVLNFIKHETAMPIIRHTGG